MSEFIAATLAILFALPVFLLAMATPAAKFALSSAAFGDGKTIPTRHATKGVSGGQNVSPPLSWSNPPMGTMSFVILAHDLEPRPMRGNDDILHWLVWNIPAATTSVAEGMQATATMPDGSMQNVAQGRNGGPPVGFRGPCPPPGQPHHYSFEVYALDTKLDSVAATATRADVMSAMNGHILGHAVLMTKFDRQP
jgi:hypothetical protein